MTTIKEFRRRVVEQESDLLKVLRSAYSITEFRVLRGTTWNVNFQASGCSGASLFVKVINEKTGNRCRIGRAWHRNLEYQERLAASGCRLVVAPVRNNASELFTTWQARKIVAYPWINHSVNCQLDEKGPQIPTVIETGARLLAILHDDMDAVSGTINEEKSMSLCQPPAVWATRLPELRRSVLRHLENRGEASEESLNRLAEVYDCALAFTRSGSPLFRFQTRGAGMVHGDFRPENVLIPSAGNSVVIDLDLLHQAPRVVDVALGALNYAGKRFLSGPRKWDRVSLFINTYGSHRRMTEDDVASALEFVILRSALAAFKYSQLVERSVMHRSFLRWSQTVTKRQTPAAGSDA